MPQHVLRSFCLVFLGGAVGTALRYAADLGVGAVGDWPAATLVVNLLGAFALGWLYATTVDPRWRLLVGTGVLGGFTTYSALAVQTQELLGDAPLVGVAYPLLTLVAGVLAARAGALLGARR